MTDELGEWSIEAALKPLLFTFLFIFTSLTYLSFPTHFNSLLCLSTVFLFASVAFLNSTELFPDSYAEEIYLRFVIIFLSHISFLVLERDKSSKVSDA